MHKYTNGYNTALGHKKKHSLRIGSLWNRVSRLQSIMMTLKMVVASTT